MEVLATVDFFTTEVWTCRGLITYLNAYVERWIGSVTEECLSQMILFGEDSLRHVLGE
jgi:hypothetical protein